jgi:3-hydroxyacyl-CoA dehydrogenase
MKRSGWVCINISPAMYKDLTVTHKYPVCERQEPLLQQKRLGKDKADMIYCWRVTREAPVETPVAAAAVVESAAVSGPSYSPA